MFKFLKKTNFPQRWTWNSLKYIKHNKLLSKLYKVKISIETRINTGNIHKTFCICLRVQLSAYLQLFLTHFSKRIRILDCHKLLDTFHWNQKIPPLKLFPAVPTKVLSYNSTERFSIIATHHLPHFISITEDVQE